MSGKRHGGFNVRQLQIDWNGVKRTPPVDRSAESPLNEAVASMTAVPARAAEHRPVLRQRWDFRTRFPELLPDVLDAGLLADEDTSPAGIEAIHREHASRMLDALSDLDAVMDERRNTRLKPARPSSDTVNEPTRLQRWYESLLGAYEDWFGSAAAVAFDRVVRAWHAHIEVVVDNAAAPLLSAHIGTPATTSPTFMNPPVVPPPTMAAEPCNPPIPVMPPVHPSSVAKRIIARLPVPKPLSIAIEEQHFGVEEDGKPIRPSADEVREITEAHGEKLVELLKASRAAQPPVKNDLLDQYHTGVTAYERSFGEHAARQLEAYVQRLAGEPANSRRRRGTSSHEAGR